MIDPTHLASLDYQALGRQASGAARQATPWALAAVGRAFGLGDEERQDLASGGATKWLLIMGAVGVAFVGGALVSKHYPNVLPSYLGGRAR